MQTHRQASHLNNKPRNKAKLKKNKPGIPQVNRNQKLETYNRKTGQGDTGTQGQNRPDRPTTTRQGLKDLRTQGVIN